MTNQHEVILQMLKEIHDVCTKNNIKYFISAGTMLGGVRHHGFLPWDDDADVWMTHAEYEKFREVCKTELPENRMLRAPEIQENYWHHLAHYTATDTTCFHHCEAFLDDMTSGEVIDIFILDPIADGEEEAYRKDLALYTTVLNKGLVSGERFEPDSDECLYYMNLIHETSKLEVCALLEKKLASHFSDTGKNYIFRYAPLPLLFKRESFEYAIPIQFEDTALHIPNGVNDCLTVLYGDSWMLMPLNPPEVKHNTASSSFLSCTEAIEFFNPTCPLEELKKKEERYRYLMVKLAPHFHKLTDTRIACKNKIKELELDAYLRKPDNKAQFAEAYHAKDGLALAALLKPFIDYQLKASIFGSRMYSNTRKFFYPLALTTNPQYFEGIICALMHLEKLDHAMRMIHMWKQNHEQTTAYMDEVEHAINMYRETVDDHQKGNYDEALKKLGSLLQEYPKVNAFNQMLCLTLVAKYHKTQGKDVLEDMKQAAQNALSFLPDNANQGFYECFLAIYKETTEGLEAAVQMYKDAADKTTHGIVLWAIKEKIGYSPRWHHEAFWAEAAGLEPYEKPAQTTQTCDEPEEYQTHLFELLCELIDACKEAQIHYVLSKKTADALFQYNRLPSSVKNFAILVDPKDMSKLKSRLEARWGNGREVVAHQEKNGDNLSSLEYVDTNTLLISLKKAVSNQPCGMRVYVLNATHKNGFTYASKRLHKLKYMLEKDKVAKREFCGESFNLPAKYARSLTATPLKQQAPRAKNSSYLMSTTVSYKDFFAAAKDFDEYQALKNLELAEVNECKALSKELDDEFLELQFAIHLKEISLDLIPQKGRIVELYKNKNFAELRMILVNYIELVQDNDLIDRMKFDEEIVAILKETMAHDE